ncbi:hypothetical protein FRX31_025008 [Thalictrum thalictroides]|uniref:Uncharacterized protein n=1 Tax=Thalictrum thalictroides TaxID=46969 RepID=A0A7J6VJY0_THATH|nr:hypothetical protein FRX31_025008 [Thalictrum thalictroides]
MKQYAVEGKASLDEMPFLESIAGYNMGELNKYQIAQRKRRERERSEPKESVAENNKVMLPKQRQIAQRKRREMERSERMNQLSSKRKRLQIDIPLIDSNDESTLAKNLQSSISLDKTHKLGQRLRRKKEKEQKNNFQYSMDGINIAMPIKDKGKEIIIDDWSVTFLYGSSSTGDSSRENENIIRWPNK